MGLTPARSLLPQLRKHFAFPAGEEPVHVRSDLLHAHPVGVGVEISPYLGAIQMSNVKSWPASTPSLGVPQTISLTVARPVRRI